MIKTNYQENNSQDSAERVWIEKSFQLENNPHIY